MLYDTAELRRLTEVWQSVTRESGRSLSRRVTGGKYSKLIERLLNGEDMRVSSAQSLSDFYNRFWPAALPWPSDVPRYMGTYMVPPQDTLEPPPRRPPRSRRLTNSSAASGL